MDVTFEINEEEQQSSGPALPPASPVNEDVIYSSSDTVIGKPNTYKLHIETPHFKKYKKIIQK